MALTRGNPPINNSIRRLLRDRFYLRSRWESAGKRCRGINPPPTGICSRSGRIRGTGLSPYGQTPLQKQSIIKDEPSGNQIFEFPIQSKPYVVAYGTSDTGTAWASTLQFTPGQGGQGKPLLVSIEVNAVNTDSLSAKFTTPFGNIPSANKNWMGLWEGPIVTFDGSNRIKKVDVGASQNIDFQSMSGLNLTINTTYSLGYGVGPKDSDLAAWVSFTTVPF